MYANELIGKLVIRTKPAQYGNGNHDNSYTNEPLMILGATESHIIYAYPENKAKIYGDEPRILNYCWCDDGWTDYEGLMKLANEEHRKLMDLLK